ncbi:transcription factor HES-7.1-like [Salvelinus namaycush]|uniref:Transcription factor HES-7.1-like n=1 Tax=Salvelinus namaycush TaxID=8040 RepID=A0A8U0TMB1_SALNM|nr:transcription factor HES-7.1-like [Salvelinus namaycush]
MKPLEGTENRKTDRKLLKPQVERRRRQRMNHSLESLRTLLLQGPLHQGVTQRRVEKAEILEHTVLFLQNTGDGDRKKGEDGEKQHPFQDGFSGCLQRAAHFLGQEGEGLQLEAALNSTFSARLNSYACMNTEVPAKAHSSNSLPNTTCHQSSHLMKIQESHYRQQLCEVYRRHLSHAHRAPLRHGDPKPPQQPHRHAAKEAQSQNLPASQSVWRPWP